MRWLILGCLIIVSTGCTHWQAPAGEQTAVLTFSANDLSAQPMLCDGSRMRPTRLALGLSPPGREDIYADINERLGKASTVSVDIPADQPLIVGVRYTDRSGTSRRVCRSAARFTASESSQYQAHFHAEGGRCNLEVHDSDDNRASEPHPWQCP